MVNEKESKDTDEVDSQSRAVLKNSISKKPNAKRNNRSGSYISQYSYDVSECSPPNKDLIRDVLLRSKSDNAELDYEVVNEHEAKLGTNQETLHHMVLAPRRNLTTSASMAANAAVSLIRRDILDRIKNRNNRGTYRLEHSTSREPSKPAKLSEKAPDFDDGNVGDEENDDNLIDASSYGAKKRRNGDYAEVKVIFDDADKADKRSKSIRFNDDEYEEDELDEDDLALKTPHKTQNKLKYSRLALKDIESMLDESRPTKSKPKSRARKDSFNDSDEQLVREELLKKDSKTSRTENFRSKPARPAKPKREPNITYDNFMEIIRLENESESENDDDENDEFFDPNEDIIKDVDETAKSRSRHRLKYHHSNHYRYNSSNPTTSRSADKNEPIGCGSKSSRRSNRRSESNRPSSSLKSEDTTSFSLDSDPYGRSRNVSYNESLRIGSGIGELYGRNTRQFIRDRLKLTGRHRHGAPLLSPRSHGPQLTIDELNTQASAQNELTESGDGPTKQVLEEREITKKVYFWQVNKSLSITVPFGHYSLLAMLDKNQTWLELSGSILISLLVSICAALMLNEHIYDDVFLILFCFIVASCHYSLLKSVQPDSSSPIHGFNGVTALSRPIYFCLLCSMILFLRFVTASSSRASTLLSAGPAQAKLVDFFDKLTLYGHRLAPSHFELLLAALEIFLLFFPLLFTFGLFPQISTFVLCVIEQIEMNVFGGTAMNNLIGALLSLARSLFAIGVLSSVLFASIYSIPAVASAENESSPPALLAATHNQFSQSVVFSVYCGLLVLLSYMLSRQTSDMLSIFSVFKDLSLFKKSATTASSNKKDETSSASQLNECLTVQDESSEKKSTKSSKSNKQLNKSYSSSKDNDRVDDLNSLTKSNKKTSESIPLKPMQQQQQQQQQQQRISTPNAHDEAKSKENVSSTIFSSSVSSLSQSSSSSSALSSPVCDQKTETAASTQALAVNAAKNDSISANSKIGEDKLAVASEIGSALEMSNNLAKDSNSQPNRPSHSKPDSKPGRNGIIMGAGACIDNESELNSSQDPFVRKNRAVIRRRLESDLLVCFFIFIFVFAIHVSTVFTVLRPALNDVLFVMAILVGALNHYVLPHLRIENPWFLFSQPVLKPNHWSVFEPSYLAKLEWFEVVHLCSTFAEKNILHVLVLLSSLTSSSDSILLKYHSVDSRGFLACVIISVMALKLVRNSFCEPSRQYQVFLVAYLFNKFDASSYGLGSSEAILFDLFFVSIFLSKLSDFMHKLQFIYVYTAPWQLPWGSAFHAFAQPLSAPHTSLLLLQAVLSSLFGAPLMPLMGSAIFLLSYMRPVKFWERNYNTKRLDNTNTRLQSQFEATTPDSENLNAIFYEHLTSVLQNSLCGDIMLGRWGNVQCGDFYVLSSDYLNCLVHIIEMGNGFVTFQLRGLEFKVTIV